MKRKIRWQFYRDKARKFRWRTRSIANGKILAVSSQGYARKIDCVDCAKLHGWWG